MKKFFYFGLLALVMTTLSGCYDDDELWDNVNDLTDRVETIEQTLAQLNNEINDMQTIVNTLNQGAVITSCEDFGGGYRLTFSNGKTLEIFHGKDGIDGNDAPVIGVKEDADGIYYWTITIDGITDWLLDENGNKLRVTGEDGKDGINGTDGKDGQDGQDGINGTDGKDGQDGKDGKDGITPIIGVDEEGYWTIDTGNGPERITDANGHYVRAIGISGDSFFTNVAVGEDEVTFYLASGESFTVYRVDNFGIEFDFENESDIEVVVGTTKEFKMTLTKVNTVFVAGISKGWEAMVQGESLFVTAPSEITNENEVGEINIIAANKRGDCRAFTMVCLAVSDLAILTFEDNDVKFTSYTLDYAGVTINKWSDLIDSEQYNGPLTYDFSGGTYSWDDANNTWLSHSFTTPYWSGGHAISNYVIEDYSTLPEGYYGWYELQFSIPIKGHNDSDNFCIHNGYVDDFNSSLGYGAYCPGFKFSDGKERIVDHMYITNTCYVLNSLTYGDGFCTATTESSYYKVNAYGYDAEGNNTGTAEFYLCNGTSLITDWQKFDLSSLGKVVEIKFNFEASEDFKGDYGLNCPAYFAYDDVAVKM